MFITCINSYEEIKVRKFVLHNLISISGHLSNIVISQIIASYMFCSHTI